MSLTLHSHPLSSFGWKVLIALYENGTDFTPLLVKLWDPEARAAFLALSPIGKLPVLRDEVLGRTVPESTIILEYLEQHYPGKRPLFPRDPEALLQARGLDRFYDLYVHVPMQKIITDCLRPAGQNDAHGVEEAKTLLRRALDMVEKDMAGKTWALGEDFSFVDCSAMPALFYSNVALSFAETHPLTTAYLTRLKRRPSVMRTLKEAEPYFHLVPWGGRIQI